MTRYNETVVSDALDVVETIAQLERDTEFRLGGYTFSISHSRYIGTEISASLGYGNVEVEVNYTEHSRETVADLLLDEIEQIQLAKGLEDVDEINGWRQTQETEPRVMHEFVACDRKVVIFRGKGKWRFAETDAKKSIEDVRGQTHDTVEELKVRAVNYMANNSPIDYHIRAAVRETIEAEFTAVDGIGEKTVAKLARKNRNARSLEELTDVGVDNVPIMAAHDIRRHFRSEGRDPIKEAVQETKNRIAEEYGRQYITDEPLSESAQGSR